MVRNAGNSRKQQRNSLLASVESFTEQQPPATATPTPAPTPTATPAAASTPMPMLMPQSGRDIVMLSGHVYRTFSTRLTPEHVQALRMTAMERGVTTQAVINSLIEEGIARGKCSLETVEKYMERRH